MNIEATVGATAQARALYARYYWKKDVWRVPAEQQPVMQPLFGAEVCTLADLQKTEFYNDFLRKHHPYNLYVGFTTCKTTRLYETISFLYGLDSKPPGKVTLGRLRIVLPHLRSALVLRRKFVELEHAKNDREAALHLIQTGVILLDEKGNCFFWNRSAERVLGEQDGLSIRGSRVTARLADESSKLQFLIQQSTNLAAGKECNGGKALLISRRNRKPLQVSVSCFLPCNLAMPRRAVAAVFIRDPEEQAIPPAQSLRGLYGFTPAESRLAVSLAEGKELRQACDEASITYTTGRAPLRNIFAKTGVRRQGELVSLLLRASVQTQEHLGNTR